jgi:ABC-type branched-subunit amino acid transport system substrate-binding protein
VNDIPSARATCSVFSGVVPIPKQKANIHAPSGTAADRPVERIVNTPPVPAEREVAAWAFAPVTIGFLVDCEPGEMVADYLDSYILAFEDAMHEGRLTRPVEILTKIAVGLPSGTARTAIDGYRALVDAGCVLVLSTGITDNGIALCDPVNAAGVPFVGVYGTSRFSGDYCFLLGNGGQAEETAVMARYLRRHELLRLAVVGEHSPADDEFHDFFRQQARLQRLEILTEHFFEQRPSDAELERILVRLRDDVRPDALVYCGFGWNSAQFNPVLERIGWDPPRVMTSAIMWALHSEAWLKALEGWVGIAQTLEPDADVPRNPNYAPFLDRFEARFKRRVDHALLAVAYDQGRVAAEAIVNAPILTAQGMKAGLERIKLFPCVLGGPRTHVTFARDDHRGYKGDWLFMSRLERGRFVFRDFHWPEFPSNREQAT